MYYSDQILNWTRDLWVVSEVTRLKRISNDQTLNWTRAFWFRCQATCIIICQSVPLCVPPFVPLCIYVSLCVSMSLCVLCVPPCVPLCVPVCVHPATLVCSPVICSFTVCLSINLYFDFCHVCQFLYMSMSTSVWLIHSNVSCLTWNVSLHVCLFVCFSMCLSLLLRG